MNEIKIAKFNLNSLKVDLVCLEHKQTCERWLEFEEKWYDREGAEGCECDLCEELGNKIKDLKQAIKLYEENGI